MTNSFGEKALILPNVRRKWAILFWWMQTNHPAKAGEERKETMFVFVLNFYFSICRDVHVPELLDWTNCPSLLLQTSGVLCSEQGVAANMFPVSNEKASQELHSLSPRLKAINSYTRTDLALCHKASWRPATACLPFKVPNTISGYGKSVGGDD